MTSVSRYWHANCAGIDIDFTTTGEHKPESADIHEFPFRCPICSGNHVALEVTKPERDILKDQDPGSDRIPVEAVERLEDDLSGLSEDEILRVDVLRVFVHDDEAFDTIGMHCTWCDKEVNIGDTVMLWGEPSPGGKYVSIQTFDTDECLDARLEAYREAHGKTAMLIKHRG